MHPFIVAELALGSLEERTKRLALLDLLPHVRVAQITEVRVTIEARSLYNRGIGLIPLFSGPEISHFAKSLKFSAFTQAWLNAGEFLSELVEPSLPDHLCVLGESPRPLRLKALVLCVLCESSALSAVKGFGPLRSLRILCD